MSAWGQRLPRHNCTLLPVDFQQHCLKAPALPARGWTCGGHDWSIWSSGGGNGEGTGKLLFDDGIGYRLVLTTNGNVGMGTTSPAAQLHVTSGGFPTALFEIHRK